MDFKTKTALCIARLYNSSACVFWLAQTPIERTQLEDGYWCRRSWRLCFLVEYLAFELCQAFPGHLCHPELAAAAPSTVTTPELSRMGNPPGLWIVSRGMCCCWNSPAGSCPHTTPRDAPRALQDRTLQVLFQKQSTKGIAQQTCAHDKRKIASPLLSLNGILTWLFP